MDNPTIVIQRDREKPILNQHPWIFSGAISAVHGNPAPGDIVTVINEKGKFLARGYWNPKSQIQVRLLTWRDEPIDQDWWVNALERAFASRQFPDDTSAYRLVNAENDYLPGLVIDRYADDEMGKDWLVLQALTLGIDTHKAMIADLCMDLLQPSGIYERSDVDVRGKEGLKQVTGVLTGEAPPDRITILEGDVPISVDVIHGHKTGFYLDQRDNRSRLVDLAGLELAGDARVLNLFSYTGAFGLRAAAAIDDLRVVNVDSSNDVLEMGDQNAAALDLGDRAEYVQGDVFDFVRDQVAESEQYDVVICDPPKFAHNAGQVEKAARGYKDLNLNSFKLIKPGGFLMTFSCSGAITRDLFQKIVFGALADSGRQGQITAHLSADTDHPIALTFPEGEYLKGLLVRVF
ncbi:MAG: class I SAM-dependent rRNA methyltransferase [bacterium]|nr:class I SAM-dependent rRNA methyltransferase [bacterium]